MAEQLAFIRFTGLAGDGTRAEGTWGNDLIDALSGDQRDEFFGYGGDDDLGGGGGDDLLDGGIGNDRINGGSGNDTIFGDWGDDIIDGGSGDDIIDGGSDSGNDRIAGGSGRDTINGGGGNDTIDGGDGNDTINGGTGDDYILGMGGNDTITDLSGVDNLKGGIGDDTITVRGGDLRFDTVAGGSGNDTINVTGTKVFAHGNGDNDTFRTDLSRETFMVGGDGNDRFVITGAHPIGSGGIAEIHGGDDSIITSNVFGVDVISSVTFGPDTGTDTLDLSQLPGSFGAVTVNLGTGKMFDLDGVQLAKITGVENIVGSSASDTLTGNGVANDIRGGVGNDTINGGAGDDTLFGGAGNDTIVGGSGRDRIIGDDLMAAASRDTLTGGADADTFVFIKPGQPATDFSLLGTGKTVSILDRITDFDTSGTDHDFIDVASLLDQSTFAGTTAQQAISQGYLYFVQSGTSTKVMFDVNGGTHGDTANNFAVVELDNIAPADLRADHFFV